MFLSKLVLNPRHPLARRDLANPYELHSTLSWAFDTTPEERVLWRVERGRTDGYPVALVQSHQAPLWERLEGREGYAGYFLTPPQTKPYTLPERLTVGQVLRFRLEANPTVARGGKRHGLRREEEQIGWLERQGAQHGFTLLYYETGDGRRLPSCRVTHAERRCFRKRQTGQFIVLWAVTYDGHLKVADPVSLREAIARGLGHAKGLGMGLLSIAPVAGRPASSG